MVADKETKALAPQQRVYLEIRDFFRDHHRELEAAAGDLIDAQWLEDQALLTIKDASKVGDALRRCTPRSLFMAVSQAARLGLEIGQNGGYLIPYGAQAQFQLDYRGMITLCVRAGFCSAIKPVIVHEKDVFEVREGSEQKLVHLPDYKAEDRGKPVLVYAIAKLNGGEIDFEVLPRAEIERRRKMSKQANGDLWGQKDKNGDPGPMYWRMALKSAVRALANRMAKSAAPKDRQTARLFVEQARREEAAEFEGQIIDVEEDPNTPPRSATEDLAEKITRTVARDDEQAAWEREQARRADADGK